MKKYLALILALVMTCGVLAGCSGNGGNGGDTTAANNTQTTSTGSDTGKSATRSYVK